MRSPGRLKLLFSAICLAPVLWLISLAFTSGLGANPVEKIIHTTGDWALNFLILTLTITPLCRLTGWSWPVGLRRTAGLFCFFYAVIHFFIYIILDQGFSWKFIVDDVVKHKRIAVGFASLMFLVPPAVTSMASMARRLGQEEVEHHAKHSIRRCCLWRGPLRVACKKRYEASAHLCGDFSRIARIQARSAYALSRWITKEGKINDRPIGMS